MLLEPDDRPFLWGEIHAIAKEKLDKLEEAIRGEIGSNTSPPPKSGGARHQFFVLLEERAIAWANRAKQAYKDCLPQINREMTEGVAYGIWFNGFRFFIAENISQLMYISCGIGPEKRKLIGYRPKKYATPPEVIELELNAREISRIVERISRAHEYKPPSQGWVEETQKLLAEINQQNQLRIGHPSPPHSIPQMISPIQAQPASANVDGEARYSPTMSVDAGDSESFVASEDFRSVVFEGSTYPLTRSQSIQFKILAEAHRTKNPAVGKDRLLRAIEAETSEVRNIWKRSPLWRRLIFSPRKGLYQLRIPRRLL